MENTDGLQPYYTKTLERYEQRHTSGALTGYKDLQAKSRHILTMWIEDDFYQEFQKHYKTFIKNLDDEKQKKLK